MQMLSLTVLRTGSPEGIFRDCNQAGGKCSPFRSLPERFQHLEAQCVAQLLTPPLPFKTSGWYLLSPPPRPLRGLLPTLTHPHPLLRTLVVIWGPSASSGILSPPRPPWLNLFNGISSLGRQGHPRVLGMRAEVFSRLPQGMSSQLFHIKHFTIYLTAGGVKVCE